MLLHPCNYTHTCVYTDTHAHTCTLRDRHILLEWFDQYCLSLSISCQCCNNITQSDQKVTSHRLGYWPPYQFWMKWSLEIGGERVEHCFRCSRELLCSRCISKKWLLHILCLLFPHMFAIVIDKIDYTLDLSWTLICPLLTLGKHGTLSRYALLFVLVWPCLRDEQCS